LSFWTWLTGVEATPPAPADSPGDPEGVVLEGEETYSRSLPGILPSPWNGWPAEWGTGWDSPLGLNRLIDVAWAAIDMNSNVLSAMPVYRLQSGRIVEPLSWMQNPDPGIYTSWAEFIKQVFWDYHCAGEAFILPMAHGANGFPLRFRVVPPWLITVELRGGMREYKLGYQDVTNEILHIRYQSNTADAHGHGPLEVGGARMTATGLLQRYGQQLAETGGTPHYWIGVDRTLTKPEADDLLNQWVDSRARHAGHPALLSGGATLNTAQSMSAKDMALIELSEFNESRISVLLGVPPYLMGLPGPGGLTYANVSQLTDGHDRSSLRPKANMVMSALSGWALPRGQSVELNRDEYTRPSFKERAEGYKLAIEAGWMSPEQAAEMERLHTSAAAPALSGAEMVGELVASEEEGT